ncbi:polysaccharide biosynthesis tyrosine autokinase [Lacipirellula limnantheis]|uniref:Tyrosine-protein kinase ptk n=1 Tax=Lacipirellula limnantheis TaxID=2528024 RepID=A0A517TY85_9BACT|nr:tyrosine-protein kinase domain-containing protein [Lacipirellula limnantheis]QDT73332.1 Tyrosine-protein kinase ptk [Lacipirellula limnantheis]
MNLPPEPTREPTNLVVRPTQSRAPALANMTPAGGSDAAAAMQGITPALVLKVLRGRWPVVIPLGLVLAAAAAAIVLLLYVPKYRASALIKIEAQPTFIAFAQDKVSATDDRYVQTQIELLRGPVVLGPALDWSPQTKNGQKLPKLGELAEVKEQADPVDYLKRNLSVSQVGKSELFEVAFHSRSPDDAATVVNAVVMTYLEKNREKETDRSKLVISELEKESADRSMRVELLRKEVIALARKLTGTDPFQPGLVTDVGAITAAGSFHQGIVEAEVGAEIARAELEAIKRPIASDDQGSVSGILTLEVANRPDVRRLEEEIEQLQDQMSAIKVKSRTKIGDSWSSDPEYLSLEAAAKEANAALEQLKATARAESLAARRADQEGEQRKLLAAKEQELAAWIMKRKLLSEKLAAHVKERESGGAQSAELEFKKSELEREESVFELIAARKLALQTEQRAPERVFLMQVAEPPSMALEPIPYKYLLVACLASMLAPLGLAVAYEALLRRISSTDQLTKESLLPVIGEVARFPRRRVGAAPVIAGPPSKEMFVFAESIDSLRTQLLLTEHLGVPGERKVVAICSAASGEGKSSLATALAMSIAESSKQPTLLIDADLRSPDIARLLGTPAGPGLAELLSGRATLREVIHRVGETEAFVLPAGKLRGSPHHIFEGVKIEGVLKGLREKFNTIIIDTPPILAASESLVFAKAADLTVVCSLADVSRAKQVRVAVERLHATGANVAGAVLSGVSPSHYVYNYGAYGAHR